MIAHCAAVALDNQSVEYISEFLFFPESQTKFFARLQEADNEFEKDSSRRVSQLIIYQAGKAIKWARI